MKKKLVGIVAALALVGVFGFAGTQLAGDPDVGTVAPPPEYAGDPDVGTLLPPTPRG